MYKNILRGILFFLLLVSGANLHSQELILFKDLSFLTRFEEQALTDFFNDKTDRFSLFLAIDKSMSAEKFQDEKEKLSHILTELNEMGIESKKVNKQIAMIDEYLNVNLLKEYSENVTFSALLEQGRYNYLTESMLYSFIFDSYNIPYKVMASLNHVYLVAEPGPKSIVIETENPSSGSYKMTKDVRKDLMWSMKENGEFNDAALQNCSKEEIFVAKYDNVKEWPVDVLQGIQYFQAGEVKYNEAAFEEAFELLKKAYIFFPEKKVELLMSSSLSVLIDRSDFTSPVDVDMISKYASIRGSDAAIVKQFFQRAVKSNLEERKNAFCDSMFNRLVSNIDNQNLREDLSFNFYRQVGLYYRDSIIAEPYLKAALSLRPQSADLKNVFKNHFFNYLSKIYLQPEQLYNEVLRLRSEVDEPSIWDILDYFEGLALLQLADASVNSDKLEEADNYLKKFEALFDQNTADQMSEQLIEKSYRSLAVKLFYAGKRSEAKGVVDRGLKFVPDSGFLKSVVY